MTERQKYHSLQAIVCEQLPYYAAQVAANAGAGQLSRLQNVKAGKTISLPDLVALVRHALPAFDIPAHLMPETVGQEATA